MALVDIVEDALAVLPSAHALARTLGVSVDQVTRVLQRSRRARLGPVAVIRAARLAKRNICDALRTAGDPALADELESLLDEARTPAQQAILDDLHRLPAPIRQAYIDLIADRAATGRVAQATTTPRASTPHASPTPTPARRLPTRRARR
jgi:hypothetical protein